jgi:hypothetical protein
MASKHKSKGKPEPEPTMIDRRRELLILGHQLKRQGKIPYAIEAALFAQNQTWDLPLSEFDMLTVSREISRGAPAKARKADLIDSDGSAMQEIPAKHKRQNKEDEEREANEAAAKEANEAANAEMRKDLHEALLKVSVSPERLVSDLETFFVKYLSVAPGVTLLLSLWTMHTHIFKAFKTVPYLNVRSPLYGSGKSTVFELLNEVVARPYMAGDDSIAFVFREIDETSPTLLMDEAEFLSGEDGRAYRRIFNAGYKKGSAGVGRLIDGIRQRFNVYCPKAFASIKGLSPGTPLFDRSITIHMQPGDASPFDREKEVLRTGELKLRLEAYAAQNESKLLRIQDESEQSWPNIKRRDRELWLPLLLHARLTSPNIEAQAYTLAKECCRDKHNIQAEGDATVALARELVYGLGENGGNGRESNSAALVELVKDGENWSATLSGKSVTSQAMFMARFLRNFQVKSRLLHGKTLYQQSDILAKLRVHLPTQL